MSAGSEMCLQTRPTRPSLASVWGRFRAGLDAAPLHRDFAMHFGSSRATAWTTSSIWVPREPFVGGSAVLPHSRSPRVPGEAGTVLPEKRCSVRPRAGTVRAVISL